VVFDWLGSNVVAVVIIEDEQVVVTLAGREGQLETCGDERVTS